MRFNTSIANRAILGGRSGISSNNNRCWVPSKKVVHHAQHQQHSHYVSSTTHKLTTALSLIGITGSVLASRENHTAECAPVTEKLSAGGVKEDDNNKDDTANENTGNDDDDVAFQMRRLSLQAKTSEQRAKTHWDNNGCEWVGNPTEEEKDIVMNMLGSDLYIFNANFDNEKLKKEMNSIVNDDYIMTELHGPKANKGEWYGTGGPEFTVRVREILEKQEDQVLYEYMQRIGERFNHKVLDVFMIYYCKEGALFNGEDLSGVFGYHRDNYRHRYYRIITTIGPDKGKTMSFRDTVTGKSVTFTVPHGTVVAMSQVASGADKVGRYEHSVRGAEDSYILGFQL